MPARPRPLVVLTTVLLVLGLSACGGSTEVPDKAASSEKSSSNSASSSATPTSTEQPVESGSAPTKAICKALDLAPMTRALGGPAKVKFDLVKGDKNPYGGEVPVAAPSCELSGAGKSVGFEVMPDLTTAADVERDLKLNRDGAATLGAVCSSTQAATAGKMKGGVHTCKLRNGYSAFMTILADDWGLRCTAFKVEKPAQAIKTVTDSCGAMLTHLSS